ncbi:MAG: DUF1724 domain-containing protein [Candidatus Bathyarchaeota archaeon]|nr:DUF1724 domain-containing protein [Candidatus Termiticorpusculum sp.]
MPLRSEQKMCILLSLLEGEKKLSDLEIACQTRGTTILHNLKELETLELTTKSKGVYKLTPLGIIEAQICKGVNLSLEVLIKHKDFWLSHDTSGIPPVLARELGALEGSILIKDTGIELQKVHNNFMDLLLTSKTVSGISPIFHPDYIKMFEKILSQGGKVRLIITNAVLERLKQEANNLVGKYTKEGNLEIYVNDNIKVAITITERGVSWGLFNLLGEYDYANDLICEGKEARDWGHQLFVKLLEEAQKYKS